jgi:hypothetical protein
MSIVEDFREQRMICQVEKSDLQKRWRHRVEQMALRVIRLYGCQYGDIFVPITSDRIQFSMPIPKNLYGEECEEIRAFLAQHESLIKSVCLFDLPSRIRIYRDGKIVRQDQGLIDS